MKKLIFILSVLVSTIALTLSAQAYGSYKFNLGSVMLGPRPDTVDNTLKPGKGSILIDSTGSALLFDGSYGVDLGRVEETFTVSARVKITSTGDTQTLFFKNMGDDKNQKWTGVIFAGGVPTIWRHDGKTYGWSRLGSSAGNCLDRWIDIEYAENNGYGQLYVDGRLVSSGSVLSGEGELYMGATYWSGDAISGEIESVTLEDSTFKFLEFGGEYLVSDLDLSAAEKGIVWTSSDPSVLSPDGKITRGAEDKEVTLTGVKDTALGRIEREFSFTVLKAPAMVNNEVVLSYNFTDETEGIIRDDSGNGNDGVIFGGMKGSRFDGNDDYVQMPEGILAGQKKFTVYMRLRPEIAYSNQFTFCFGSSENEYFFLNTSRPGSNAISLALTNSGIGGEKEINSVPGLRINESAELVITVSETDATMYINGIPVAAGSLGISPWHLHNTTKNYLAKSIFNDPLYRGNIYEFTIYPRVMTEEEIRAMAPETTEPGYITRLNWKDGKLKINTSRFCMIAAQFMDENGEVILSATRKVSSDSLETSIDCSEIFDRIKDIRIAAYDADTGIVKDMVNIAANIIEFEAEEETE
ncbi:MAG: hypothetical protein J1F63_04595 [Oscillospiraceae bacterium]|nr:hypothetical protein [Oscillospiraceae bacterium]